VEDYKTLVRLIDIKDWTDGPGYQERSVSRERVRDSSGGNWWSLSMTFRNEDGLKKKKNQKFQNLRNYDAERDRGRTNE